MFHGKNFQYTTTDEYSRALLLGRALQRCTVWQKSIRVVMNKQTFCKLRMCPVYKMFK